MASEYSLRLKAKLDTTEVQNELNKLRQMQQSTSQQSNGQNNGVPGGLNNLAGLASTISRLETSIKTLDRTFAKILLQKNAGQSGSPFPYLPFATVGRRNGQEQQTTSPVYNGRSLYTQYVQALGDRAQQPGYLRRYMSMATDPMFRSILPSDQSVSYANPARMWGENSRIRANANGGMVPPNPFGWAMYSQFSRAFNSRFTGMRAPDLSQFYNQNRFEPNPMNRRIMTGIAGYAAHSLLPEIGQYAEATGHSGIGKAISAGGRIGGQAAAGFAFGGPMGAAIMGGAAALGECFRELSEKAKKLADELESQSSRVKESKTVDDSYRKLVTSKNDERRMKVGDVGYFKSRLASKESQLESTRKSMEEIGTTPGDLTKYEKETERLLKAFGETGGEKYVQNVIRPRQRKADQWRKSLNEIPQLEADIAGYKDSLSKLGFLDEKQQETADFNRNIPATETRRLEIMRKIFEGDLEQAQEQKKLLFDRAEETGQTASIVDLEEIQTTIDDLTAKLDTIGAELGKRSQARKYAEIEDKKNLVETLQDALTGMKAPSMEQVNSLAASGYLINQRDDEARINSQINYMREQADIQKQIRDIVKELDTSSTFSN